MKRIIALIAAASVASGLRYDGLRVKFGWSDALADIDYFYHIPRSIKQAEREGWKRLDREDSYLPDLRMYCLPKSKGVCGLYDVGGFVAGLQINIPKDQFTSSPLKPEKIFKQLKVSAKDNDGKWPREYWTITQYFVSKESLGAGTGPLMENGATLQDGGVWVRGPDGNMIKIPYSQQAELDSSLFKKQNCVPNMGIHYYYNMTPELKCEDLFPWFALVTEDYMYGTGFQTFGKLPQQPFRHWFEDTPYPKQGVKTTIPDAPACLADWGEKYGVLSLHIYYVDNPWDIRCKNGDSKKPAAAMDRLLLNGYRYASKMTDEVKKIFSG